LAEPKHNQQEETFRVIDRRLFNAEGQIREEALREEREESAKPAPEAKLDAPPAPAPAPGAPPPAGIAAPAQEPAPAPAPAIASSRGFEMLVNFVAQNAAMLLGAYPDPRSGQAMLDLEGARELIDMLVALRDATRGNLSADDDRLLLDVLGSLQLSFMEMTKAAAKAMQDKAKARP
jgi:Domain of unknown function (DUF1844)